MSAQRQERRRHKRLKLACPVSFLTRGGRLLAKGKSVDLSDGGTFVSVSPAQAKKLNGRVTLTLSVPRSTENTFMLEDFACRAEVVRRQSGSGKRAAGIAIAFTRPLDLALEV